LLLADRLTTHDGGRNVGEIRDLLGGSAMPDAALQGPDTAHSSVPPQQVRFFRFGERQPNTATGHEDFWIFKSPAMKEGWEKVLDAGWMRGIEFGELIDVPGHFNVTWGRLKPGHTIPLHYHGGCAIYLVTAGSGFYGNVEIKAGDGLYQPPNTPYQVKAGDRGLEIFEIRSEGEILTHFASNSPKYWDKVAEETRNSAQGWAEGEGVTEFEAWPK
jgi:mannose-6-phosphate isomerase-like protein (cupin superfamily)